MVEKLRTAVVGCGKVGHLHAKTLIKLEQSDFIAVYDPNIDCAREFAKQYGVKAYDDIEIMITESDINMVSICTPHSVYASVTAVQMGCHVLIEKTLATNLADCDEILAAATFGGAKVGVVYQHRFYRPCLRMKQAINSGKIGSPTLGTITMLGGYDKFHFEKGSDGGGLIDHIPHQLDLLLWYMGEVEEVCRTSKNLNHPTTEIEETVAAVIKFKNGGIGNILISHDPTFYGKVHIHGDNGASIGVQMNACAATMTHPPYNDLWTITEEAEKLETWKKEDGDFFNRIDSPYYYRQLQIENFINSLINNIKPLVDGDVGRQTIELTEAIYRSTKQNSAVGFPIK